MKLPWFRYFNDVRRLESHHQNEISILALEPIHPRETIVIWMSLASSSILWPVIEDSVSSNVDRVWLNPKTKKKLQTVACKSWSAAVRPCLLRTDWAFNWTLWPPFNRFPHLCSHHFQTLMCQQFSNEILGCAVEDGSGSARLIHCCHLNVLSPVHTCIKSWRS